MSKRIRNILLNHNSQRFLIIYGEGVEDIFMSEEGIEKPIENALCEQLKDYGYGKFVILSSQRPIYFFDPETSEISYPQKDLLTYSKPDRMRYLHDGPLKDTYLIPSQLKIGELFDSSNSMGDVHSLRICD